MWSSPSPSAPLSQPSKIRRPWFRRRGVYAFGALGTALAVAAAVVAWPTPHSSQDAKQEAAAVALMTDRAPFDQALAALAAAPGVHYSGTDQFSGEHHDITVTAFGERFGTTGIPGLAKLDQDVLSVGGKDYSKFSHDTTDKGGVWTFDGPGDDTVLSPMLKSYETPADLASRLAGALDQHPRLPVLNDPHAPAVTVGDVPALKAVTAAGSLFITKSAPYRVLRLEPTNPLDLLPSMPSMPSVPTHSAAAADLPTTLDAPVHAAGDDPLGDSAGTDVSAVPDTDEGKMFDTLAQDTKQLSGARDGSIDFQLTTQGNLNCGPSGCNVQETFSGDLGSFSKVRITSGQVTATLTVSSVTIGGRPAPGCVSAPQTFPITGNTVSGSLSCDSPGAGPIYDAVSAQAQEEADREAQASGGTATVPFSDYAYAEVDADALAVGEVDQLIDQQNQERREADCQTPNSFAAGTPVLLADGSTRPIDRITPGTRVLTTDVASGQPADEPVLARITTSGPKDLADVTVTDGRRTGTVTATANHPFWDAARDTWTLAGDIRPGEVLDTPADGSPVRATADRRHQETATVYNLAVSETHTYYVVANGIPVLVHNICVTAITMGKKNLALGVDDGDYSVKKLADKVGAADLMDPKLAAKNGTDSPPWRTTFISYLGAMQQDPSLKLSFEISGIPGNSPAAALKLARQAVANGNYMQTQWELVQIEHDGLLGRVQFYDKLEPWTRNIVWR